MDWAFGKRKSWRLIWGAGKLVITQATKAYRGSGSLAALIHNLGMGRRWVVSGEWSASRPSRLIHGGNDPCILLNRRLNVHQGPSGRSREETNNFLLRITPCIFFNKYINQLMHFMKYSLWHVSICYMFRHWGTNHRESFGSKKFKSNTVGMHRRYWTDSMRMAPWCQNI